MRDSARAALRALHQRCVGCETQGRPGRSGRPIERQERWGNRRRRSRRRGAATAIEWRALRREPQAVVRSTLPEAEAAVTALVRTPLRGAVRSEVRARSAGAPARVQRAVREPVRRRCPASGDARGARGRAEAMPAAGAAGQGERGEVCDERCAKRRREENAAVVLTLPLNIPPPATVRHAAVSEASRRASGARSDRRERRREGYPPEGARPRSGLDRVARSRSDAPRLIVWSRDTVSTFGTIDCITACTVASSIGGSVSDSIGVAAIGTGIATITGIVVGVSCMESPRPSWR